VVAETGLIFVQVRGTMPRLFALQGDTPLGKVPGYDYFFARHLNTVYQHDLRETAAVFVTHALKVNDDNAYADKRGPTVWRRCWPLLVALVLALGIGYLASAASTLTVHYNYQARLDQAARSPLDSHAQSGMPTVALDDTRKYESPAGIPASHSPLVHAGAGAGVTGLMAFLRLRFDWWPLHPIGFLLVYTYPIAMIWFSLMLGWIAKALIVKFGGPPMMRAVRPIFLGLIIGESAAAACWLMVSLALLAGGRGYEAVNLLPG
jgi:hypothetical protein